MEGRAGAAFQRAAVSLLGVTLHEARFSDRRAVQEAGGQLAGAAGFGLELGLSRPSPLELAVSLTLSVEQGLPYELLVAYGARFAMDEAVPEASREQEWRDVAFRRAPALLYPYVRELVSNLTGRGADPPLLLPELPEPLDFSDDEQRFPPPPPVPTRGGKV
jgi:hypothetical protein